MKMGILRAVYGLMLIALLITPFGVYHSLSEPYITGYLLGYHLPIGYAGLVSGIPVMLYPKLVIVRNFKFATIMTVIGLFLLLPLFFSPRSYVFINLFTEQVLSQVRLT